MLFSHKELEEGEKFDVLSGIITGAYYWHWSSYDNDKKYRSLLNIR
jgi:hypothetical protein